MSFQLKPSKMSSSKAQVTNHLVARMVFSPTEVEPEYKLISMKFVDDSKAEQQATHWVLRRASPIKAMLSHAMGFVQIVEPIDLIGLRSEERRVGKECPAAA